MSSTTVLVSCKNLTKRFDGLTVVNDVSLTIFSGELLAIAGQSGSGKSTLLGLLSGLERPDAGEIMFEERRLTALNEDELALLRRNNVGFVFQSFNLIPTLSALENVKFPLYPVRSVHKSIGKKAVELLERVGLKERLHHLPSKLSGGEKQRVALARALINDPKIIFADEPTGNLDSTMGEEIFHLILRLNREMKSTFVIVTHDESLLSNVNRIIRIKDGKIIE